MTPLQTYRYLRPSALHDGGLALQTSGGPSANPRLFSGFLTAPRATAAGLLAVAEVARARYHQPVNPVDLDPVVTGSRDRLRFESFSGCCGVYARLDVSPAVLDGDVLEHGTTNVDVNASLREALARVGGLDPLHLSVGPDDCAASPLDGPVVERRVPLPARWLRGFAEAHVLAAEMALRAEVPAAEAAAFLRRLPAAGDRSVLWAVPAGRSLRLTSRPAPGGICLAGAGRLAALRGMVRCARSLRVYGPALTAGSSPTASVWELDAGGTRLSLTLSAEPYRGFSGEGGVLTALTADDADDVALVSALLSWDPTIHVPRLAAQAGLSWERVQAALTRLGTAGRVGYDVAEDAYFQRVLPYDAGRAGRDNPRLVDARALVEAGAVGWDGEVASVRHGTEVHRVRRRPEGGYACSASSGQTRNPAVTKTIG